MTDRNDGRPVVFRLNKHTRSRQGCQTCRSRKVKCDEEHPQCRNCIRAKRECIWTRPWNRPCTVISCPYLSRMVARALAAGSLIAQAKSFTHRAIIPKRISDATHARYLILVCLLSLRLLILSVLLKLLLDCRTDDSPNKQSKITQSPLHY
ncbi:hypothetical protein KCU91_g72, partial [Aureobasidium melanogenum]